MNFEGPEKKVELLIRSGGADLRSFGDAYWSKIVQIAQAQILSKISTPAADAYLLSESSLFVSANRVTMITCGRTLLVKAIIAILEKISVEDIELLVYERKNEHFPEAQHSTFEQDVAELSKYIPGRQIRFGQSEGHHILLFTLCKPFTPAATDTTLEILMHGLSDDSHAMFQKGLRRSLDEIRKKSGIWEILPGFKVDDYLFKPMGYSLNALKDDLYYTFHVTPQEIGSYASFETNYPFESDPIEIIDRVLKLFKPKECNVFFFQHGKKRSVNFAAAPTGYTERYKQSEQLECGFHVDFFDYEKRQK